MRWSSSALALAKRLTRSASFPFALSGQGKNGQRKREYVCIFVLWTFSRVASKKMKCPDCILNVCSFRSLPHSASFFHTAATSRTLPAACLMEAAVRKFCATKICEVEPHFQFRHVPSFCKMSSSNLHQTPEGQLNHREILQTWPLCILQCDICARAPCIEIPQVL